MLYLLSLLASLYLFSGLPDVLPFRRNFVDLNDVPVKVPSTLEDGVLAENGGIP